MSVMMSRLGVRHVKGKPKDFHDVDDQPRPECGRRFCIQESHPIRQMWALLTIFALLYVSTIFPFTLCFVQLHPDHEWRGSFRIWEAEIITDVFFWLDLVLHFFFTYKDRSGVEVLDLRCILRRYLRTWFFINLLSCLPPSLFEGMFSTDSSANKAFRLLRIPKLFRLIRMLSLGTVATESGVAVAIKERLSRNNISSSRSTRIAITIVLLGWIVHIMACGWYTVGVAQAEQESSWLGRRILAYDSLPLLKAPPLTQWLNSVYFVVTVFSTVGFGDMSAFTPPEILYVCVAMIAGTVVNSIIISEVISILLERDSFSAKIEHQREMLRQFAVQTQIGPTLRRAIDSWLASDRHRSGMRDFDKYELTHLLTKSGLPREILNKIPDSLHKGKFVGNSFVSCHCVPVLPPRQVLTLALTAELRYFVTDEIAFYARDYAQNLYLVFNGTFSFIARMRGSQVWDVPNTCIGDSQSTNISHVGSNVIAIPYHLFSFGSYFGDADLVMKDRSRSATARCETETCTTLLVDGEELHGLRKNFPNFGSRTWLSAVRREAARTKALQKIRPLEDYLELATSNIQHFWRRRRSSRVCRALSLSCRATSRKPAHVTSDGLEALLRKTSSLQVTVDEFRARMVAAREQRMQEKLGLDTNAKQQDFKVEM